MLVLSPLLLAISLRANDTRGGVKLYCSKPTVCGLRMASRAGARVQVVFCEQQDPPWVEYVGRHGLRHILNNVGERKTLQVVWMPLTFLFGSVL